MKKKQDNAMAHIAKNSTDVLDEVERVTHGGMWTLQSPNLNAYNFYQCGMLQHKVYANNPHAFEALQQNICHEFSTIPTQQLQRVSRNICS
jgi:hypothetical protein